MSLARELRQPAGMTGFCPPRLRPGNGGSLNENAAYSFQSLDEADFTLDSQTKFWQLNKLQNGIPARIAGKQR